MSVTVSGGLLHLPRISVRPDQIEYLVDCICGDDRCQVVTRKYGTINTTATRTEIVSAIESWDRKQIDQAIRQAQTELGESNV